MSSESYKKFLETQAKKKPIDIERVRFIPPLKKVKKEESSSSPSNLLESVYLKKDLNETIVVERGTARMLRERLTELEKKVNHLNQRLLVMRLMIIVLLVISVVLALWKIIF
jgi:hypothetical protein